MQSVNSFNTPNTACGSVQRPKQHTCLVFFNGREHTNDKNWLKAKPDVIVFTQGLSVFNEAGARLVQVLLTLHTLQTRDVPAQVRKHTQHEAVTDLEPTTDAGRGEVSFCRVGNTMYKLTIC